MDAKKGLEKAAGIVWEKAPKLKREKKKKGERAARGTRKIPKKQGISPLLATAASAGRREKRGSSQRAERL